MKIKSLVIIVNISAPITIGTVTFNPGVPVFVYRNRNFFVGEFKGRLLSYVDAGRLVGYDFDGEPNTKEQTLQAINFVASQITEMESTYSQDRDWMTLVSTEILDGFKRVIDLFDWTNSALTQSKTQFAIMATPTINMLTAGYLDIATDLTVELSTGEEQDFFNPARKGLFLALFNSALTPIE